MSESTRPAAASSRGGRGSGRGGRFGARSSRGKTFDDQNGSIDSEADNQLGALRKKHGHKLTFLQEMFNGWSDSDLLSALEEADGDEGRVAELISEGAIEQWQEVQKDVHRPKKEPEASTTRPARGGRNTAEGTRGRGRNTERGGARAPRGRSQNVANGSRSKDSQQLSAPTDDFSNNDTDNTGSTLDTPSTSTAWGTTDSPKTSVPTPNPPAVVKPAEPPKPTWASLLRKPDPPKPAPKPKEAPPKPAEPIEPLPPAPAELDATEPEAEAPADPESEQAQDEPEAVAVAAEAEQQEQAEAEPETEESPVEAEVEVEAEAAAEPQAEDTPTPAIIEPEIALPPSKDKLTQSNLEQVLDTSAPPVTETAASVAADSWDPRNASTSAVATPLSTAGQPPVPKPAATPSSGYATTALKATAERQVRTPSFARRVLDQEEAVRMPGNREVDGAAVQFGAFNLNEDADDDEGAEEQPQPNRGEPAETRAQPPADSPIAHPRTALPPSQPTATVSDGFAAQKPAVATPIAPAAAPTGPAAANAAHLPPPTAPTGPAAHQHQHYQQQPPVAQPPQNTQQFDRFGPPGASATHDAYQKSFGGFGQQVPSTIAAPPQQQQAQQPPVEAYPPHQQPQAQPQPNLGSTSGPNDYSSYATADPHSRNYHLYGYYNNSFHHQAQQDSLGSQARGGGFGAGFNAAQDTMGAQYPGIHNQSRFAVGNDAQNSGHSTPNPSAQNQVPPGQQQQGQQGQPPQSGVQNAQAAYQGYHPYMQNQYYAAAAYGAYPYGGYGGPYGKAYGHPYGGPVGHFEHSASPAPGFGQAAAHRNEAGPASGGLDSYGRVGGGQGGVAGQPGIGGGAMGGFGAAHDSFRSGSYQSQGQAFGGSQSAANATGNDDLKPFSDPKAAHSPAVAGVRPTSAANNAGQASGLPPPSNAGQGQMGAFGGYPAHLNHLQQQQQQSYGMSNNAGNAPQGATPYGSAGGNGLQGGFAAGAGGGYGAYGNQGHRVGTGWGNNYH